MDFIKTTTDTSALRIAEVYSTFMLLLTVVIFAFTRFCGSSTDREAEIFLDVLRSLGFIFSRVVTFPVCSCV